MLLLWRHRFITDTWGWEIPLGRAEPGEGPAEAAAREVEEETGWRPGPLRPLLRIEPKQSVSDRPGGPGPALGLSLGSERGLATPSPDAKGREPLSPAINDHALGTLVQARTQL